MHRVRHRSEKVQHCLFLPLVFQEEGRVRVDRFPDLKCARLAHQLVDLTLTLSFGRRGNLAGGAGA